MKPSEIKTLREANTIEEVVAMVDCRDHEYSREEQAAHVKTHLLRQYSTRLKHDVPEATAINQVKADVVNANGGTIEQQSEFWRAADAALNIPKAEKVETVYYRAAWDELLSSEACYSLAIAAAHDLGGVETYNSNDGNRSKSFAPSRTFDFDDGTAVTVTYGACFAGVIEPIPSA